MRIPDAPPEIRPSRREEQPLWSVMIPVYNCSSYLPELLNSLLPQALSETEMQIEVVDDCSTDTDVESMVKTIGKGRISYFRQRENVGSLRNFETCLNRSKGKYVHLLHGDDRLLPGFYEQMTAVFEKFPEAGAAFCAHDHIDSNGNLRRLTFVDDGEPRIIENWLEMEAERQRTQYVAMVVKRSVYELLGGFYGVTYGEDWEMWARIGKYFPVAYTPKILAQYREHDESISGTSYATGKNLKDIAKVIDTINEYLPKEKRKRIKAAARKNYAYYAVDRKAYLWRKDHQHPAGLDFFISVAKMHADPKLVAKMLKLFTLVTIYRSGRALEEYSIKRISTWKDALLK